ncbi:hypothetical protein Cha6605_5228 [Chamaesiphon minutus PCC 6605]|uniref:Uncharacterized protein n=1 Tax=Chamaesiphon minutus (strain ATCC 27169 / PCC 6605) TaxID=1173020 RepID=K9ULX4_CHAP6|nr:hypothetical protein Cha6605_5228 [Chamaesiphon minutus PCC 6605]
MSNLPPNITKLNNFGHIWYQLCPEQPPVLPDSKSYPVIILSHRIYHPPGVIIYNTTLERSTAPVNVYQASHK